MIGGGTSRGGGEKKRDTGVERKEESESRECVRQDEGEEERSRDEERRGHDSGGREKGEQDGETGDVR